MIRGVKRFSLFLLVLLVLCSFTSVYAEDMDNLANGLGESNLNENINEISLEGDSDNEESLMETSLIETGLSDEDNMVVGLSNDEDLVESESAAEDAFGDEEAKSYRDLYIGIASNPNNFTLTDDYTFNPEIDLSLTVVGVPEDYGNYVIDGQGHTIDALGSARFFMISANNVTLRNITFKNGNSSAGPLVHFSMGGTIENCTFVSNYANQTDVVLFDDV